jgi:UDP-N-acetylmuramoylalanine--D-glutamate ligase
MNMKRDRIAILGMGRTGQSLARFFLRQGHVCEGFDEHKVELPADLELPVKIGHFDADLLAGFDRIVVSPGIRWSMPVLVELREKGIPVTGDLDIFLDHYSGPIIAITGTNGKTTTTFMIETMMETLPGGIEAGGNVGIPMLDLLTERRQPARVVLELSSFQLERSSRIKPQWAVLLNFQNDHADMHTSNEEYLAAKMKLFERQGQGDTAMFSADPQWNKYADELQRRGVRTIRFGRHHESDPMTDAMTAGIVDTSNGPVLFWSQDWRRHLVPCERIPARGSHQHMNLAVAAQAAADYGVTPEVIREAITSFRGLKHRIEHVAMAAGRDWFDDSKATNPDSAIASLNSFGKTVWICGGLRKGLDLNPLVPAVKAHVSKALVIGKEPDAYTNMLEKAGVPFEVVGTIEKAVTAAAKCAGNDPVLLAPAAASQDQFKDYAERGNKFAEAVLKLGGGK